MAYAKVRYVDNKTGIPVDEAPATNGPRFPHLNNIQVLFANKADWPVTKDGDAVYWVACGDNSNFKMPGVIKKLTKEELDQDYQYETEKMKWKMIQSRDAMLSQLGNSPEDQQYAQHLLGIENQLNFPWNIEWQPTEK